MSSEFRIGVCTVELRIPSSFSLKDKRQVVRSIIERARSRFNVSIAEIGNLATWNVSVIGIAYISNNSAHAQSALNGVVDWLEAERLDVQIGNVSIEIW